MLDIALFRDDPEGLKAALARRGDAGVVDAVVTADERRRALLTGLQALQSRRNEASREIGAIKRTGGDATVLMTEVAGIKDAMAKLEDEERQVSADLESLMLGIPNLPFDDVPDGVDESGNVVVREVGTPRKFDFTPREHFEIPAIAPLMDFEAGAKLSGARFVVLRGQLARLERAIGQFMLDLQAGEHGYEEVATPVLVREDALLGTGQLPKFADDLFRAGREHWLIPTAEVTLTNLERESILEEETLPRRVAALTPCFRAEAGAAGRDTRGMLRQHQFSKVELVSITRPEDSEAEHERMLRCAAAVLDRLGIPYRVVLLCAGDMGFSARKTWDIEAWLPGQNRYREISSCSNCGDFQARRMRLRCRTRLEKKTRFVHTLNGSGLAVGRTLIAVLETWQQADGSVLVPEALRPWMGKITRIGA